MNAEKRTQNVVETREVKKPIDENLNSRLRGG